MSAAGHAGVSDLRVGRIIRVVRLDRRLRRCETAISVTTEAK